MKPDIETKPDYHEISCQQILVEDKSVFSIQRLVIPGEAPPQLTGDWLLQLYLQYIRRCTGSIIRPVMTQYRLELRLGSSDISLISFNQPLSSLASAGSRTTLCISGGLLVQPRECDRGELDFMVDKYPDSVSITLQLSDFCPLLLGSSRPSIWRKILYRLTQAYIHKVVTIGFLAVVYQQLTGDKLKTRIVKVVLRKGEET